MAVKKIQINGEEPTEEDNKWLEYGDRLLEESSKTLDEDAKSFVALGSSLLTVYTGALALFKFTERLDQSWENLALMSIPIALWIVCIIFSAYVFFPGQYHFRRDCVTDIIEATKSISKNKYNRLKIGAILFIIALGISSLSVLCLSNQMISEDDKEQSKNVQLVAFEGKISVLRNLSIPLEEGTLKTNPLMLMKTTDKTYVARLQDGTMIEIDKNTIAGVIYL